MQSTSCEMLGWMKHKLESRLLGEISIISDMQITPSLCQKAKRKLKNLLMKVKKESEKSWLETQHSKNEDHGIWSHHLMADRWGNNGNSERLYFGGTPKSLQMVTAAMKLKDSCSLGKAMTNLDSILKSRDITLLPKVHIVKGMVFLVVM